MFLSVEREKETERERDNNEKILDFMCTRRLNESLTNDFAQLIPCLI